MVKRIFALLLVLVMIAGCGIADELLQKEGFSLELLMPLMEQTLEKLKTMSPKEAQTGPAARRDTVVMGKQMMSLSDPRMRDVYEALSAYIMER